MAQELSSLHKLRLEYVSTEPPWRNKVNLTAFRLVCLLRPSFGQILDFFENAPHLHEVELCFATLTPVLKICGGTCHDFRWFSLVFAGFPPFLSKS